MSRVGQGLSNRIKRAVNNVRSRHQLHPASRLMPDSLHGRSQPSARTCCNPTWSHCSSISASSGILPRCLSHGFPCCYTMPTLPPRSHQACFPFPRFCLKSPPAPTLHLIVFSYPPRSCVMPKLLVPINKPWSRSHCLPLSQAPYLVFLSAFTPLDPRLLPSSRV